MVDIREKLIADEGRVAEIIALATKELRRVYAPASSGEGTATQHRDCRPISLVAVIGNVVAGVVEYHVRHDEMCIRGLAVDPQQRRCGIARSLIHAVERIGVSCGKSKITLSTIKETGNPQIFAKLGFSIVSEGPAEGFHGSDKQQVTKVNMCRTL